MAATLYLHIGLPKTGTTYLQGVVFPRLVDVEYLRRQDIVKRQAGSVFQGWSAGKGFSVAFTRSPAFWKDYGEALLDMALSVGGSGPSSDRSALISFEGITDPNVFAAPTRNRPRKDPWLLGLHLKECSDVAKAKGFASLKAIVTFREQARWLGSMYAHTSDRNSRASQRDFEEQVRQVLDPGSGYYREGIWLDYAALREQVARAIGAENVLMLPQEMLSRERAGFLETLRGFLGHESAITLPDDSPDRRNVRSLSEDTWRLRGYRIRFGGGRGIKRPSWHRTIRLRDELKEEVRKVYEESNRALDRALELGLERFGYF